MKRTISILMGLAILTMSSACQSLPRGVSKDAVMVGLADSGKLVRLTPGQQLVIELESNPVTGFQWEINHKINQTVLLPDGSRFNQTSAQKNQQHYC